MKQCFISLLMGCTLLAGLSCHKKEEKIIGPAVNEIGELAFSTPSILADGVSTAKIVAVVYDTLDRPARGQRVFFETTSGSITSSAISNSTGEATAILTSTASETDIHATITASFHRSGSLNKPAPDRYWILLRFEDAGMERRLGKKSNTMTKTSYNSIDMLFRGVTMTLALDPRELPADGISAANLQVNIRETSSRTSVSRARVHLRSIHTPVADVITTNERGIATAQITSLTRALKDTLYIEYGNKMSSSVPIGYILPHLELAASDSELVADGTSRIELTARLSSHKRHPIEGAEIFFSTTGGIVSQSALTGDTGEARAFLVSGSTVQSTVWITARFHEIADSVGVAFVEPSSSETELPNSISLEAEPNFIWVREAGNIEQTMVTATILNQTGDPISAATAVKFTMQHGPDGGEFIEPAETGSTTESIPIHSENGKSRVKIRSGIRPGTVEVKAELPDYPEIAARSTNIVIRSGPPYIYIDPNDPNRVLSHMTLASDYKNLPGWFTVDEFQLSLFIGDKYNNPIDEKTAIYLSTTGGIVTTDVVTGADGSGRAKLITANPLPRIDSEDPNAMNPHEIANPNDENVMIPIAIPDFDFDGSENDGIAYVLAKTHGRDQNGEDAIVYAVGQFVFSGPLSRFEVETDRDALDIGEVATITVRVQDVNGNPVAKGSTLKAETSHGRLSDTDLMPGPEQYWYGSTIHRTQLINNLDPAEDVTRYADVTFKLQSPNGTASESIPILLRVPER